MTTTPWRYACAACRSVVLKRRSRRGGYRCNECGHVMAAGERIDKRATADPMEA